VTLVVDEFQTLPGADYEQILGELAKYGANVLLASQTLSRLDRLRLPADTRPPRGGVLEPGRTVRFSGPFGIVREDDVRPNAAEAPHDLLAQR
jgi:hypothetical protein